MFTSRTAKTQSSAWSLDSARLAESCAMNPFGRIVGKTYPHQEAALA